MTGEVVDGVGAPDVLDVLVVGAGPAGMLVAAALHRQGVRCRVVDEDEGPTDLTRAPVLWQRTQEVLTALGICDAWLSEAEQQGEEALHFYGACAGSLSLSAPDSPFPEALYAGQDVTERLLEAHLVEEALAHRARFPHALRAVLLPQGPQRPGDLGLETVVDAEGRFARDHGLPASGMLLVRPDGYIGHAATAGAAGLAHYLERWLRPAGPAPSTVDAGSD